MATPNDLRGEGGASPVAIISGMGPGLGEALSRHLQDAGYKVAGLMRAPETYQSPQVRPSTSESGFRAFACDVGDAAQVCAAMAQIEREMGPASVLIHNAMLLLVRPFRDIAPSDFEQAWRVICLGAFNTTQAVLPQMLTRGAGTIMFTGATAAVRGGANFSAFASAKFALRGLSQSLARELGPQGIHVVHTIIDCLIWSPQTRERFKDVREEACLSPDAIAKTYLQLIQQDRSCWTQEIDLRPASEKF